MADWIFPLIFLIPLALGVGYLIWRYINGSTGNTKYANLAKILMVLGVVGILWTNSSQVMAALGGTTTGDNGTTNGIDIDTDYSIVWAVDSTTAVISGDFAQTDEVGSSEYALEWDEDGNTDGVTVTNTCTALSACTWDAFSFTNTITANFESEWMDGARVTSMMTATIDSAILNWGVVSNRTGINVPFVDVSPLNVPGLIWVDGAGTNKAIGNPTAMINEFSGTESITSSGLYWAVNEDQYSTLYNVPTGLFTGIFDIVYSDDFGFSHTVVLTISLTIA
jgi:hypothetical protein